MRCMKVTPELWIKRSVEHINEIRYILNCMLIIHESVSYTHLTLPTTPYV